MIPGIDVKTQFRAIPNLITGAGQCARTAATTCPATDYSILAMSCDILSKTQFRPNPFPIHLLRKPPFAGLPVVPACKPW